MVCAIDVTADGGYKFLRFAEWYFAGPGNVYDCVAVKHAVLAVEPSIMDGESVALCSAIVACQFRIVWRIAIGRGEYQFGNRAFLPSDTFDHHVAISGILVTIRVHDNSP
jgi:hypothetical protein